MFLLKLALIALASACVSSSVQDDDLTLTLFYEGLCPGCHDFIQLQLYPAYPKLAERLKLDLVPHGKMNSSRDADGKVKFSCQHGIEECVINRVHACVLDQKLPSLEFVNFIYHHLPDDSDDLDEIEVLELAKKYLPSSVSWDKVYGCYKGDRGTEILLSYEDRQSKLNPPLPWIPNIRFNGVYDRNLETQANEDLISTVCGLLKDNKPEVCGETNPK
ncbi:unnamed protein product [Diabrotica balteata]|uniref:Gamma-interferon-inducible lysosomal thiol reductase n=1 Tax=Diabrotica balteata TaxID=107213 RepID=A0A9N9T0F9_DIABA|nr:unnamed protein product [Diabrotica balteata]